MTPEELARQRLYMKQVSELLREDAQGAAPPRAFVRTYGCQQNVADSERIRGLLAEMGYALTDGAEDADFVLFNTCAVREHAEQRVFGNVGALKPVKEQRPSLRIGLCGCMMQEEHVAQKIRASYPYVDLVFGTHAIYRLPELVFRMLTDHGRVFETRENDSDIAEGLPLRRGDGVRGWLPVMYGCNNFCSYCVVPYVRGRERSRAPEAVLGDMRALIADGCKDITLLGQNVNSYGRDLPEDEEGRKPDFAALLRRVDALPGDFRIRFMTSHPKDATEALFDAMARCGKVSKHLHLPFQAGSDRVLKAMNRGYTKERYLALVQRAREKVPGISITSDVIVGFPGETRADFEETLDVVRRARFNGLFTFVYSPRRGTPAEKLDDPVPHEEKTRWFSELLKVQEAVTAEIFGEKVGKTLTVLAEGPGKTGPGFLTGRADDNTIVDFPGAPELVGQFVPVCITKSLNFMLVGEIAPADEAVLYNTKLR